MGRRHVFAFGAALVAAWSLGAQGPVPDRLPDWTALRAEVLNRYRDLVRIDPELEVIGWRRDARGRAEFVVDRDGDEIPLPLTQLRGASDESSWRFEQRLRALLPPLRPRTP